MCSHKFLDKIPPTNNRVRYMINAIIIPSFNKTQTAASVEI